MSADLDDQRKRVSDAAIEAQQLNAVMAVDVLSPKKDDERDRLGLDLVVLEGQKPGVPPEVHERSPATNMNASPAQRSLSPPLPLTPHHPPTARPPQRHPRAGPHRSLSAHL